MEYDVRNIQFTINKVLFYLNKISLAKDLDKIEIASVCHTLVIQEHGEHGTARKRIIKPETVFLDSIEAMLFDCKELQNMSGKYPYFSIEFDKFNKRAEICYERGVKSGKKITIQDLTLYAKKYFAA